MGIKWLVSSRLLNGKKLDFVNRKKNNQKVINYSTWL